MHLTRASTWLLHPSLVRGLDYLAHLLFVMQGIALLLPDIEMQRPRTPHYIEFLLQILF